MENFTKFLQKLVITGNVFRVGLVVSLTMFSSKISFATDYYVNDGVTGETGSICTAVGNNTNTGTNPNSPYLTLTALITNKPLTTGDVVYIDVGTYNDASLMSGNSTDFGFKIEGVLVNGVPASVFDANGADATWMMITKGEIDNITLKNLYIKNYDEVAASAYGGAIKCTSSSGGDNANTGFVIENCIFDNCSASTKAGAIYWMPSVSSPLNITKCTFKNNSTSGDGGAIVTQWALTLSYCVFYSNTISNGGGSAIYLATTTSSTFTNCLFYQNTCTTGTAAIYMSDLNQSLTMWNCTIVNNVASTLGGGVYINRSSGSPSITMYNCIGYGNSVYDFSKTTGGTMNVYYSCYGSGNNLTSTSNSLSQGTDPKLTSNYKLSSSSPCINSGYSTNAPTDDLALNTRSGNPDIGCYELICSTSYSGPYDIGTTGNWTNLTAAIADLQSCMTGTVTLNLQSTYDNTLESYPVTFKNLPTSSTSYYLQIQPKSGVNGRIITSSSSTGTILIDGADYIYFNGSPGGGSSLDTTNNLLINNTGGGYAFRYVNDATYNRVKYCKIKGANTTVASGTIFISSASSSGNDSITIAYNKIYSGSTTSANAIYASGATANNDNIAISNNFISDYFAAGSASNGILLSTFNSSWAITNNRFYQTTTRTKTAANQHSDININNASGVGFSITSNTIGYATQSGTGTYGLIGTAGTTGASASRYIPIYLNVGTTASTVLSNTITNIAISAATNTADQTYPGVFAGIAVIGGAVTIGSSGNANNIGTPGTPTSITYYSGTSNNEWYGIYVNSSNDVNVTYNKIGGMSTHSSSLATIGYNFYGIYMRGTGAGTVTNNTIGSTTTSGSITIGNSNNTTGASTFQAINIAASCGVSAVTDNTIQNCKIDGTNTSTASSFKGIYNLSTSTLNIDRNNIYAISCVSGNFQGINSTANAAISVSNNTIGQSSTSNDIAISSKSTSANVGIYISSSSTYTVSLNVIQNITLSGNAATIFRGFDLNSTGAFNLTNNTVSTIINSDANANAGKIYGVFFATASSVSTLRKNKFISFSTSQTSTPEIYGVWHNVALGTCNLYNNLFKCSSSNATIYGIAATGNLTYTLYYNTVDIGGTGTGSTVSAPFKYIGVTASTLVAIKNNIFNNSRTGGTANYSFYVNDVGTTTAGYIDYNFYSSAEATNYAYIGAAARNSGAFSIGSAGYGGTNSVYAKSSLSIATTGALGTNEYLKVGKGMDASGVNSACQEDITSSGTNRSTGAGIKGCYEYSCGSSVTGPLTWAIGTGGDYATLTEAINKLKICGFTDIITMELNSSYDATYSSSNEIYPIVIDNTIGVSSSKFIKIRPGSGVTATISGSNQTLINLDGADYIQIDGQREGTGETSNLTITNTASSAVSNRAIVLKNGATNNSVKYCTLKSDNNSTTAATAGVVFIGDGTNSSNTISNNTITYATTSTTSALVSENSSGSTSSLTISNNKLVDFLNWGVYIGTNGNTSIISDNDFYTSSTSLTPTANVYPIYISNTGSGYTISGNDIGGRAVNCGADASPYTLNSTAFIFTGIYLSSGTASTNSIQGNTIKNITLNTTVGTSSGAGIFSGIYVAATGTIDIGTTTANNIGNLSAAGASTNNSSGILVVSTTSGGWINGIGVATTSGTATIQKNNIGCIGTSNVSAKGYVFYGIKTSGAGTINIGGSSLGNTIGSTTIASSIVIGGNLTGAGVCSFYGIDNSSSGLTTISYNNIYNTGIYGTGASLLYGINNTAGSDNSSISYNVIKKIELLGTGGTTGVFYGINQSAVINLSVTYNTISNITHTNSLTVRCIAFSYATSSSKTVTVSNNTIGSSTEKITINNQPPNGGGSPLTDFSGIYILSNANTYNLNDNYVGNIVGAQYTSADGTGRSFHNLKGISTNDNTGKPAINLSGNTVEYIQNKSTNTSSNNSVSGISLNSTSTSQSTIKKNIVRFLSSEATSNNSMTGLSINSTNNILVNNLVILTNSDGSSTYTNKLSLTGVSIVASSTNYIYYNTFSVGGSDAGTNNTCKTLSIGSSSTTNSTIYNNIIQFSRSGTFGDSYCIDCGSTNAGTWVLDNNYYVNSNTTQACSAGNTTFARLKSTCYTSSTFNSASLGGSNSIYSTSTLTIGTDGSVNTGTVGRGKNLSSSGTYPNCQDDLYGQVGERDGTSGTANAGNGIKGCYEGAPYIFYSRFNTANTAAQTTSNWSSNRNGSGIQPTDFTTSGQTFIIQNNHQYQLGTDLTGSSTSILKIESGGAIDLNAKSLTTWQRNDVAGNGVSSSGAIFNSSSSTATLSIPITLTAAATVTSSGSGGLTLTGNITNGGFDLTVDGSNATTISTGVISGAGGITKSGSGTLTLSGDNTYTGTTTVSAGMLKLGAAGGATNTPLGTTAAGTVVSSGASLDLNGYSLGTTEGLTINGTGVSSVGALTNSSTTAATWQGTVALNDATNNYIGTSNASTGTLTVSGVISGSNPVQIVNTNGSPSKVIFTGTNTYTGATTVSTGTLNSRNNNGTGTTAGGVSVTNGATLELQGATVGAEALTLNGLGVSTGGALRFISGTNVWGGVITLNTASRINADAGTNSITGGITGTNINLTIGGAGDASISTTGITTGSGTVTKDGAGIFTIAANSTTTGTLTITAGTFKLGASNVLADAMNMVLNGGTFSTGSGAGYSETLGTLNLSESSAIYLGTSTSLNFSNSSGVSWTGSKILTIDNWSGTAGSSGTAGKMYCGSNTSGLGASQLLQITFTNYSSGASILTDGEIVPYGSTFTTFYYDGDGSMSTLSNWGSNTDGSGTNPTSFTGANLTFYVIHNFTTSPANDAPWSLNASSRIIVGNGTNATNFTITANNDITGGQIDVSNNATLTISSSSTPTLGTLDEGSTIVYAGISAQTIPSNASFPQLTINNSNGVSLTNNATVTKTLTLSSGKLIVPASGTLTLGTSSISGNINISGGTTFSSYIVTTNNTSSIKCYINSKNNVDYFFPMGDASHYTPMTFTLNNSTGSISNAYLTTYVVDGVTPGFVTSSFGTYLTRYWSVTQSGITSPNYNISYTYDQPSDVAGATANEANLIPVKVSSGTWYKPTTNTNTGLAPTITNGTAEGTGGVDVNTNTLTWSGLSTFSFDTGAGDEAAALPIHLLYFTAKPEAKKVRLDWATASETNNDYFTVERSEDGEHFNELFKKPGAGISTTNLYYFGYDNKPLPGTSYYRLKQTDYDGKFAYSDVESVSFYGPNSESLMELKVYPNPVENGKFHLNFDAKQSEKYSISIYDAVGKLIYHQDYQAEKGINDYTIELPDVASGMYQLEVRNDNLGVITKSIEF